MPDADRHGRWYRQPVLWLGAAVFVASLAGCVWIIAMGARHADTPVEAPHAVFGVPSHGHAQPAAAGTSAAPQ
ncbi:MAG TPA: hypothetical protein VFR91_08070 [Dyella sp.]|nr:hypothetical protein [Dyella sp.]